MNIYEIIEYNQRILRLTKLYELTQEEAAIALLISQKNSITEIEKQLNLGSKQIQRTLRNCCVKLGVSDLQSLRKTVIALSARD